MTEIIDIVKNWKNRTRAVVEEIFKGTLHHDIGQVKHYGYSIHYLGQMMIYLMTMDEQHLSIYEVLIHTLEQFRATLYILNTGHLPITLISPTWLKW